MTLLIIALSPYIEIQCYVLEDETRVLSLRGLQRGIGISTGGAQRRLSGLIQRLASQGADLSVLSANIQNPIEFQPPRGGRTAFGYEATILADICEAVLAARAKAEDKMDIKLVRVDEMDKYFTTL